MMIPREDKPLLVLIGPTAIGKTSLSLHLAQTFDGEIVSVDSMQVYKYLDIGTAKATREERQAIPHHLIDIVEPDEDYDAARFAHDAMLAINDIHARNKLPLVTGGTGLYLQALLYGLSPDIDVNPEIRRRLHQRLAISGVDNLHKELQLCDLDSAKRIDPTDTHRVLRALEIYKSTGIPWSVHLHAHQQRQKARFENLLLLGLTCDRTTLYQRINNRTALMIEAGLEGEVQNLLDRGYHKDLKPFKAIGYRHMVEYLHGLYPQTEMIRLLARDTRRYAKRQYTWFNRISAMTWFERENTEAIISLVADWLNKKGT